MELDDFHRTYNMNIISRQLVKDEDEADMLIEETYKNLINQKLQSPSPKKKIKVIYEENQTDNQKTELNFSKLKIASIDGYASPQSKQMYESYVKYITDTQNKMKMKNYKKYMEFKMNANWDVKHDLTSNEALQFKKKWKSRYKKLQQFKKEQKVKIVGNTITTKKQVKVKRKGSKKNANEEVQQKKEMQMHQRAMFSAQIARLNNELNEIMMIDPDNQDKIEELQIKIKIITDRLKESENANNAPDLIKKIIQEKKKEAKLKILQGYEEEQQEKAKQQIEKNKAKQGGGLAGLIQSMKGNTDEAKQEENKVVQKTESIGDLGNYLGEKDAGEVKNKKKVQYEEQSSSKESVSDTESDGESKSEQSSSEDSVSSSSSETLSSNSSDRKISKVNTFKSRQFSNLDSRNKKTVPKTDLTFGEKDDLEDVSRNIKFGNKVSSFVSSQNSSFENTSEINFLHTKIVDLKQLEFEIQKDDLYGLIDQVPNDENETQIKIGALDIFADQTSANKVHQMIYDLAQKVNQKELNENLQFEKQLSKEKEKKIKQKEQMMKN